MKVQSIFAILAVTFLLFLFPATIFAQNGSQKQHKQVVLAKDAIRNSDYFASGNTVTISGTVDGDVYAAGGTVLIDGVVHGDVIAGGGTVTIAGTVAQDVRVGGGTVTISGKVGRNVTVGGGSVSITSDANIAGSIVAGGGQVSVSGPVGKDVIAGAGQLTLGSTIGGNVKAGTGQLTLHPGVRVGGDLTYWSKNEAAVQEGALVTGRVTHNLPSQRGVSPQKAAGALAGAWLAAKIVSLLSALLVGIVFIKLTPVFTKRVANTIIARPWPSLGVGFLAVAALPFAFILLLMTIIGIPFAFMGVFAFLMLAYFAKIFVAIALGQWVVRYINRKGDVWALVAGLLVYALLTLLPLIGWLVTLATVLFGVGAYLIVERDYYKELRTKKVI